MGEHSPRGQLSPLGERGEVKNSPLGSKLAPRGEVKNGPLKRFFFKFQYLKLIFIAKAAETFLECAKKWRTKELISRTRFRARNVLLFDHMSKSA
jgi:hypothetical protein